MHSATKQRPIDGFNGDVDANSRFYIDVCEKLHSDYISQQKEYTIELYKNLNQQMAKQKPVIIEKFNENRQNWIAFNYLFNRFLDG